MAASRLSQAVKGSRTRSKATAQPVRKSNRLGGGAASARDCVTSAAVGQKSSSSVEPGMEDDRLLDQVEYLKLNGIEVNSIQADGIFRVSTICPILLPGITAWHSFGISDACTPTLLHHNIERVGSTKMSAENLGSRKPWRNGNRSMLESLERSR